MEITINGLKIVIEGIEGTSLDFNSETNVVTIKGKETPNNEGYRFVPSYTPNVPGWNTPDWWRTYPGPHTIDPYTYPGPTVPTITWMAHPITSHSYEVSVNDCGTKTFIR